MKKEQNAIKEIIGIISRDDFEIGSALPSERKLSSLFNISRNTVRSALRKLEARGIIDIRNGSGCYLLCKHGYVMDWLGNADMASIEETQNLIEARYLIEPYVVSLSAKKISKESIQALEKCLAGLNRAIIAMKKEDIVKKDAEFRRIIYCSCQNSSLIFAMTQLMIWNQYFFTVMDQFTQLEKDRFFLDYINILNALEQKDSLLAKEIVEGNIFLICELLLKYTDLQSNEFMREVIFFNAKKGGKLKQR